MASTILELAASMVRIFEQMRLRCLLIAAAAALLCAETARADLLLYRCGTDICRVAPNGTGERRLTRGGTHTWLSASADGSRMAVVRDTFAHLLDGRGREVAGPLARGGTVVIAELSPDGSQVATIELLPEISPAPVGSPPGSPGIPGFQPYLFLSDGTNRDVVAREDGAIVLHRATAVRVLTADGGQPSWSPDGSRIAFERDGDLYVARSTGRPREQRIGRGAQPVWTTAPACNRRVRMRLRRRSVIVTACAPRPGRVTITLRANGRRVARRTVRAATGGTVEVRFRRPAGRLQVAATVR